MSPDRGIIIIDTIDYHNKLMNQFNKKSFIFLSP